MIGTDNIRLFEGNQLSQAGAVAERLRPEVVFDRSETCFAGLGTLQTGDLTAEPRMAARLRHPRSW